MAEWLLRLKGEKFDLEDLPSLLRLPELSVTEDDGFYYLRSSEFDSLNSPGEVCERGRALIKLINGAAKLYRDSFQGIAEDGVILVEDDGKRHHYFYLEETLTIRSKTNAKVTVVKSDGTEFEYPIDQPSHLESWLRLAQKQKVVADALHFYREDSWISLYKVYEIVKEDVGGGDQIANKGWATKSALNRFRHTAQSRAALGDYARHAVDKGKPPSQPMSFSEAKSLIRNVLMEWLITKHNP